MGPKQRKELASEYHFQKVLAPLEKIIIKKASSAY